MKRKFSIVILIMTIMWTTACSSSKSNEPFQHTDIAMGTIISQSIYGKENITTDIMELLWDLEENYLSKRLPTSELYKLNEETEDKRTFSAELEEIFRESLAISYVSKGALDITLGEVVELWDRASESGELPDREEITSALEQGGYEKVVLSEELLIFPGYMKMDLGAVGKGVACDKALELLEEQKEVTGAVVAVGGSVVTYGTKPDGSLWKIGIVNPKEETEYLGYLVVDGGWFLSTSGDYERYFEVDGERYHHIIDSSTGYPSEGDISSVTILGKNGLLCDGLSTACFVLGVEKGLELADAYDVHALILDQEGNIYMTDGMKQYFERY